MFSSFSVRCLLVVILMWTFSGIAYAGKSVEQLKQAAQARSANIKEYKELLNNPEQEFRLAALDEMLNSDDLAMKEIAYGICFSSPDATMKSLCLRHKMADISTINIQLDQLSNPNKTEKDFFDNFGKIFSFEIQEYNMHTGQIETHISSGYSGNGRISGVLMEFNIGNPQKCLGEFTLDNDASLVGTLSCQGNWAGTYTGRISLQK